MCSFITTMTITLRNIIVVALVSMCFFFVLTRAIYTKPSRNKHTGCVIITIFTEVCTLDAVHDHPAMSSPAFLYTHEN